MNNLLAEWIRTRPQAVQALAREFPLYTQIPPLLTASLGAGQYFVIGYDESDHLIISNIDPEIDYEIALEHRRRLCAQHLRDLT